MSAWGATIAGYAVSARAARINADAGTLTISTGGISGATQTLTVGGAGDTTIGAAIGTTTGGLTKDGAGVLTLSGTNTYTGATTINGGTLRAAGGSAIADTSPVTLANTAGVSLDLTANETIGNLSGGGVTGGNITLNGNTLTVNEAVATKPDGIAVMGHPGDDAFDPLIDDARSKGILVTAMNTELPNAMAKYAADGFGYVGAVLHDAGAALADEAVKRGGLKAGDRAFVWGLKSQPGRGERTQGILDALEKAGLTVDYLEINDATNKDPSAGVSDFTGYASAHKDLKAIFIDHGNLTSTIPTYMKAAKLDPGSIYAAGFDLSPATVQGVKDGYVNLVIDQQQYLQGFLAIEQLCLAKKFGFSGLFVNTGGGFVDKSNIDAIAPLVTSQIR
jgi:simple sugar transport system substrate-binding protein